MYNAPSSNQRMVGEVGATAWNGRATIGKATGEVVPPLWSARRAACCPQIFIPWRETGGLREGSWEQPNVEVLRPSPPSVRSPASAGP